MMIISINRIFGRKTGGTKNPKKEKKQNRKNPKKGASLKPISRRFSSFVRYFCVSRLRSLSQPFPEKEA